MMARTIASDDRSEAVPRRPVDPHVVGGIRPTFRGDRIAAQRRDPCGHEREARVAGDRVLAEHVEPSAEGGDAPTRYAARPTRWRSSAARSSSPLACACTNASSSTGLLEPVRGAPMQLLDRFGFAPSELGPEHVAEQVVVPVPSLPIERHQEQVLPLDRLEGASGAGAFHDRVAEGPLSRSRIDVRVRKRWRSRDSRPSTSERT